VPSRVLSKADFIQNTVINYKIRYNWITKLNKLTHSILDIEPYTNEPNWNKLDNSNIFLFY